MRSFAAALLAAAAISAAFAQPSTDWKKLEFLLGEWMGAAGEKDTQMGAGQGAFSFESELNQKIIVRRNRAEYDSGARHDDLMVIYGEADNSAPRAIYFDSEGHVIHYRASFPSANRVVFESEAAPAGPKYRLTYWLEGASLKGRFEVAPPGSDFKPYLNWTSTRKR